MKLKNWGEDPFIEHVKQLFSLKKGLVGIGDDCAVIPTKGTRAWLVTTDALVEGIHFLKEEIPPQELGYKTVAVSVSDMAAMGGQPLYALLSIALPSTTECSFAKNIMKGIKHACDHWGILLLGGDTVGSKRDLFLSLTLIGSAQQHRIRYRHRAHSKDSICVTGYLGDSGGGLKVLQDKIALTNNTRYLLRSHFHPQPSVEQGLWLATHPEVHAMMDLSDGLDCDLRRLLKQSHKGAHIQTNQLPISPPLACVGKKAGWDLLQLALTGGEDYCLLLTVAPGAAKKLQSDFETAFGCKLFCIGEINSNPNKLLYYNGKKQIQTPYTNFSHF